MATPTSSAHDTANIDLGAKAEKPNATIPGTADAAVTVWEDDRIDTGLWECTPGAFAATRVGYTEICTILSGTVTLEVEGAEPELFGPGDVMVTPSGWEGTWIVHEPLRKHYTIIKD
ncbi:cupin domain-containing protein [Leucobacter soli]|uniref:(S)-ureidoglycine aminohydrolase cupin domain-containing protein n=1 Tax=Leucobacter soli TaxID=2812850 RepID=A0A916JW60_9MICO|nr:cupin domain-containing protein [Leucobacter soli]CAG7604984.1 hypothetical protein LEUCIP111803_00784 [Leucobacter soli]